LTSQRLAAQVLGALAASGIRHFYLAPGSRSQALALAAAELEQQGKATLTVRLDERSLAFTALGRSLAGEPAAVITTSGTAVANLAPAALEAFHAGVPLLFLTADRPAELRGKGANQTTEQPGLLKVLGCFDVSGFDQLEPALTEAFQLAMGVSGRPGPVQLNLQFAEPLSDLSPSPLDFLKQLQAPTAVKADPVRVAVLNRAVVIAGAGAGPVANEFAQAIGAPLLAEPSSGARFGAALAGYQSQLSKRLGEVNQVFVFGKPTLSRAVIALCNSVRPVVVAGKNYEAFGIGDPEVVAQELTPIGTADPAWTASWVSEPENSRAAELANAVWEATGPEDGLLFGASNLIRAADRSVSPKQLNVFANRGLAGIDGTVSTALGLAQHFSRTRALIGDLTLLHDAGGLNLTDLGSLNVQLIVGNDSGGSIFRSLEIADQAEPEQFGRLFLTPQSVEIESLAKAYGWHYRKVSDVSELISLLELPGFVLIDYQL
jgi:2-succinyl-5-enolpyruvyl-6-hydroxy-3-cyclohexene-1-carboxylate synthase